MTRCRTPITLRYREAASPHRRGTIAVACKLWRCPDCGPGRRAEALTLIRQVARWGAMKRPRDPLRFITLTYPADVARSFDNPADVAASSRDFRELVKAWRRTGRTFEYVRVFERTKRGRIHIHVLMWGDYLPKCTDKGRRQRGLPTSKDLRGTGYRPPCYCKGRCIQALAWRAGFGYVDVRAVRSAEQAAAYLAKYLAKQSVADWPRYARRLSCSSQASGGVRLMDIHARRVERARRRGLARCAQAAAIAAGETPPPELPRSGVIWIGLEPTPRPPPWEGGWCPVTGERLPDPF